MRCEQAGEKYKGNNEVIVAMEFKEKGMNKAGRSRFSFLG